MTEPATCANCDAPIHGEAYCGRCGQETNTNLPTLREFLGSFFEDALSLDSKLVRTVQPLLVRPGFLTLEYLSGKRAAYARPFRLYLVCSLLFFTAWVLLSALAGSSMYKPVFTSSLGGVKADSSTSAGEGAAIPDSSDRAEWQKSLAKIPLIGGRLGDRFARIEEEGMESFQSEMDSAIRRNLPKMAFVMVPLYAVLLQLLYLRRRKRYLAHLVFALHFHAFVFALFFLALFAQLLPGETAADIVEFGLTVWFVLYLYKALRRVYGQGKGKTVFKFLVLSFVYSFVLVVGMVLTTLVSFLGS